MQKHYPRLKLKKYKLVLELLKKSQLKLLIYKCNYHESSLIVYGKTNVAPLNVAQKRCPPLEIVPTP